MAPGSSLGSTPPGLVGARDALPPGTAIGDFVLDELIAHGGFGQVYRAARASDGRIVAIKVLHGELCSAPNVIARFQREAEVMARVRHPNVVELVSWGTVADGRPYLAMEFLAGTDLGRVLVDRGRLPLARVLEILAPTCAALTAAHGQAIVHRDLKASNLFLARGDDGGERVVLIDFGIAKLAAPDATDLTTSRQLVGTPVTMAPEQISGGAVTTRTDVYALGVMTFHLVAGRLPFEDDSPTIVQYLHAHARRPRLSAFAPVPPAVDDVIARAMAIDPEARFATAEDFHAALAAAATDGAVDAALAPRPGVAILVEARVDDDALLDPDDALLADLEGLLPLAERSMAAAGYPTVMHSGNSILAARPLGVDADADRARAIDDARTVATALDGRAARDPRVGYVVVVHVATALCAGDAVRAGDLVDVAYWTPDPSVRGVVATRTALDGLPVVSAAVSDSRVWLVR